MDIEHYHLNDHRVIKEKKQGNQKFLESNENDNKIYQNFWYKMKVT
jgi:hypothetical protein